MADLACLNLHIPARLHREQRESDSYFPEDEKLYRRFPGHLDDEDLQEAISFDIGESYNRSKHSTSPADVLLDCERGKHFEGWGVISFAIRDLIGQSWTSDNIANEIYSYKPDHRPERCNYAHTELSVSLNGQATNQIRKAVRRKVRKAILDVSKILRGLQVPIN